MLAFALDGRRLKENDSPVISRMTRKNQVTIPAEIVRRAGLKPGSRLDWRLTDREGVLEVVVLPDRASLAASLRGRGNRRKTTLEGSAVERLHQERREEEDSRSGR